MSAYLCAVCHTEAIPDSTGDEWRDVVVIHAGCYWQIALTKILPLDRCIVCNQLVCPENCPNRVKG